MELIIASANNHKIQEFLDMMPPNISLRSTKDIGIIDDIPETAPTLEGNALMKARYIYSRTGLDCFADDTGLEVAALNGAPGVHSARYATDGHDHTANVALLLKNLQNTTDRSAQFRTVIALIINGEEHLFEGVVGGRITEKPSGSDGFGYDPVFEPDNSGGRTFAQMQLAEKNLISHRGRAAENLIAFLENVH